MVKNNHIALGGMVLVGVGFLALCGEAEVFATASTISLGIDNNNLSLDIVSSMEGIFNSSANSNVTVSTNNATGYTLSIKANNSTALVNTADNTLTIPSISSAISESDFSSSATYNNMWGYKPSKFNSADNTDYLQSPSTTGDILDATSSANATANTYTMALGARIDNNTPPGSYNNAFTIMAIANAIPYTISYNANAGSDTVTGMPNPSTVSSSTYAETVTLDSAEPERDGYNFLGWCTVQTTDEQACTDASGTGYSAGGTWTLDQTGVSNSLTLYAVWEQSLSPVACEAGKICYNVNSLDPTEGTMGKQDQDDSGNAIVDASTVTLLASNFSRSGYGFAGWSDAYNYATNPSAHFYGPSETITAPTGTTANGLSLYAVWVKSAGSLQDTAKVAELCGTGTKALTPAPTDGTADLTSVSALTDQRDNETYAIAKLADGNCWMIENLRLESTNSDNSTGNLAQGYGISTTYGNFSGLADAESTGFTSTYTANSLYYSGTQEGTASIDIGTPNYPAYRMPRYNNWNNQSTSANRPQNPTSNSATNSTTNAGMYSYGNYYTWHAAIADLTYNGTNNQSTTGTSLCPTGWRLPQGGNKTRIESNDDNDFWNLTVDALNGGTNPANYDSSTTPYYTGTAEAGPVADKLRSYPNNFLYSGYFTTSSASNRGSNGYYWSSTAGHNFTSYDLYLNSSSVTPGTNNFNKNLGSSIRCTVSAST